MLLVSMTAKTQSQMVADAMMRNHSRPASRDGSTGRPVSGVISKVPQFARRVSPRAISNNLSSDSGRRLQHE